MSGEPEYLDDYKTVADRLAAFVKDHPNGRIETDLVYSNFDPSVMAIYYKRNEEIKFQGSGLVVVKAKVWKEPFNPKEGPTPPDGTGLSSMPIPGLTQYTRYSETENAETSAIGRALAAIGYLAKDDEGKPQVASKEEIAAKTEDATDKPTTDQLKKMFSMASDAGFKGDVAGKKGLQALVLAQTGKHSSKQLVKSDMDVIYKALSDIKAVVEVSGGELVASE